MDAVKLEGGGPARVKAAKAMVDAGIAVMVGWCRLTASKPVLKAPIELVLEAIIL
jgi:hypothetical protein